MENKKAVTTTQLIVVVILSVIILTTLAIFSFSIGLMDQQISTLDVLIGNLSFNETYQELMHPGMVTMSVTGPKIISIGTLIGMVLVMLFIGMKSPKKNNLWIMLDIMILIVAEIIAVAVKIVFERDILNLTPELFQIFSTTLAEGSKWILNLPTIVPTVGVLIIAATYIINREDKEEESDGFLQIEDV